MEKRKPNTARDWAAWCNQWDSATHAGKKALAEEYGISYDSARHWRSDCNIPVKPKQTAPVQSVTADVRTLLAETAGANAVDLDFVSFDLETSNLKADFSILLSAVIKPFGRAAQVFRSDRYPTWDTERANDEAIVRDIAAELSRHAIVITHYGAKFDIPYLRAKMAHYNMPVLPPMFGLDTYKVAKANFAVGSRRLQALCSYFDLGDKSGVEGPLWVEAAYNGSKTAMDQIVEHNIVDCEILERLAALSFPFMKAIPRL